MKCAFIIWDNIQIGSINEKLITADDLVIT